MSLKPSDFWQEDIIGYEIEYRYFSIKRERVSFLLDWRLIHPLSQYVTLCHPSVAPRRPRMISRLTTVSHSRPRFPNISRDFLFSLCRINPSLHSRRASFFVVVVVLYEKSSIHHAVRVTIFLSLFHSSSPLLLEQPVDFSLPISSSL